MTPRPMAAALQRHTTHPTSTSTTTTTAFPTTTQEYQLVTSLYGQRFQCPDQLRMPYKNGCHDKIAHWIKSRADILFILGFCVISFLKLCFLGILRYEIREMIQKIKILQEKRAEIEAESNAGKLGPKHYEHNGGAVGIVKETNTEQGLLSCHINPREQKELNNEVDNTRLSPVLVVSEQERERERPVAPIRQQSGNIEIITTTYTNRKTTQGANPDEEEEDDDDALQNTPLLSHSASSPANYSNPSTKSRLQRSFLSTILNHHDYGNDSDTNSHCALLITEDNQPEAEERRKTEPRLQKQENYQRSHSNGNNNSYEMKEMNKVTQGQSQRDREVVSHPSQI